MKTYFTVTEKVFLSRRITIKPIIKFLSLAIALMATFCLVGVQPCSAAEPDPTPIDLGMPEGYDGCVPNAINDLRQVVGEGLVIPDNPNDPDDPPDCVPVLWANGHISTLPLPKKFAAAKAVDINNNGQIVGSCWNWAWDPDPEYLGWYETDWKACLWEYGSSGWSVTLLGAPKGKSQSQAIAINDAGQIYAETLTWVEDNPLRGSAVWKNGKWTVLYDANGGELQPLDYPRMNERGDVLSRSYDNDLVLWRKGTATKILKYFFSSPSLDNLGRVAGVYEADSDPYTAFIYQPDSGLQTMPVNDVGWLTTINDAGQTLFWQQTESVTDLLIGGLTLGESTTPIGQVDFIRYDEPPIMNASGDILGGVRSYIERPFYANAAGTGVVLLNGLPEYGRVQAYDMNGSGVIVGTSDSIHPVMWVSNNEPPELISVGQAIASTQAKGVTVEIPLTNHSTMTANNVKLTTATLGGVPASGSLKIGTIAPGATVLCRLSFKNVPSGDNQLNLAGISSLGEFSNTQMVTVP